MLRNYFLLAVLLTSLCIHAKAQKVDYVLVVHGGAGNMTDLEKDSIRSAAYYAALDSALAIGNEILSKGGDGELAVLSVVSYFEQNPLFNAGVGATCTADGQFELDASIMRGKDLMAGSVAGVKHIKSSRLPRQPWLTGRASHTTVRTVHVYSGSLRNGAIF